MSSFSIAILGGGLYGSFAAQKLAGLNPSNDKISITLFTLHEYSTVLPANIRLVTGGFQPEDVTKKYSEFLDKSIDLKIVKEITEFDENSVSYILANSSSGSNIETGKFDIIIIATGLKWYHPIDYSSIGDPSIKGLEAYNLVFKDKVEKAKKIVVVGGGEVGCELTGELAFKFQNEIKKSEKEIYLIHLNDNLLDQRMIKKVRNSVKNQLSAFGIKIILDERVEFDKSTERDLMLSSGLEVNDLDVVFKTIGPTPIVPKNSLNLIDEKGYVKINDKLQTKIPNIFAIGDITDLETKTLKFRDETIDVVVHNVILKLQGRNDYKKYTKFISAKEYKPFVGVSLGPTAAAAQATVPLIGTVSIPSFLVVSKKSKNLLTDLKPEFFPVNK